MSDAISTLQQIRSEDLSEFFDSTDGELRPWQTKEWNENRESIISDACEWCGETEQPMHIHHTGSGPDWQREWIVATDRAFVLSEDWESSLGLAREECPNCALRDYYKRKTKTPTYRCNNCNTTFESPRKLKPAEVISSEEYDTKPYVTDDFYSAKVSWLRKNRNDAKEAFQDQFESVMETYVEMINVVSICQSCHFQEEQTSNRRCTECGENWHKYNKEMCWDCLVDKKGLVQCGCGDGWYQESKYNACSDCR